MQPTDPNEWADLLRAANGGDTAAYGCFLRAVTPVLRGIIRARGYRLGPETCEDVLQEVLLGIHLKRHTWNEAAPLRPWLYAIARYKVVDAFRARGVRIELPIDAFADALPAPVEADVMDRHDIDRMIAALDPRSADIVRAIGLDGASVTETGARLRMTEGAVRVALHRALRRLAAMRERLIE